MTYNTLKTFIINSIPQISCLRINFTNQLSHNQPLKSIHQFYQFCQRKNFFLQNNVTIPYDYKATFKKTRKRRRIRKKNFQLLSHS